MKAEGLAVVRKMREILTPEGAWTQGSFARTASGVGTLSGDPEAVCFCLQGAMYRSMGLLEMPVNDDSALIEYGIAKYFSGSSGIAPWNDAKDRTQEQVLAKLDYIIEMEME